MKMKHLILVFTQGLTVTACSPETSPSFQTTAEGGAPQLDDESATDIPTSEPTPLPQVTNTTAPTPEPSPQVKVDPVMVLFIGSSHIFHGPTGHDLPTMFFRLADSGGHRVSVERSSDSGVWLSDHLDNTRTMDKLRSEEWDYVILQEDMYMGAREDGRQEFMYPAIRALNEEIVNSGAETILFNPWANPAPIYDDRLDEYLANQELLSEGYETIAQELDLLLAPVDRAIIRSLEERPDLYFWVEGDEHGHANFMGSYLAAAVFYAIIFQESPEGMSFVYSPEETSQYLQALAAETVLENPIQ